MPKNSFPSTLCRWERRFPRKDRWEPKKSPFIGAAEVAIACYSYELRHVPGFFIWLRILRFFACDCLRLGFSVVITDRGYLHTNHAVNWTKLCARNRLFSIKVISSTANRYLYWNLETAYQGRSDISHKFQVFLPMRKRNFRAFTTCKTKISVTATYCPSHNQAVMSNVVCYVISYNATPSRSWEIKIKTNVSEIYFIILMNYFCATNKSLAASNNLTQSCEINFFSIHKHRCQNGDKSPHQYACMNVNHSAYYSPRPKEVF